MSLKLILPVCGVPNILKMSDAKKLPYSGIKLFLSWLNQLIDIQHMFLVCSKSITPNFLESMMSMNIEILVAKSFVSKIDIDLANSFQPRYI